MAEDPSKKLKVLYQQIADLTLPECKKCKVPLSCCSPEYCEMAFTIAKEEYGMKLRKTDHPRLPLMGPTGCTAPPHVRPLCSLHVCQVNSWGFLQDPVLNKKYFELRDQIEEAENEKHFGLGNSPESV